MASPSPFIPPRPLSRSAPPVNPNVVPPLAQGQPPPGGAPSRGRQPGGFSGHPGTFTGGSPYHILPNNIPWVIPDNPIAPAGNAGFSSDWTGFPADLLSSSAGPPPPAPAAAQAPPAGAPPAGFGPVGPTPQAANWSVPLPAGYGSAPSTGYVPYQSLPVFGMPSFPGMMGIAGLPGMPGMQGVPMVPQSTPGNRTQAFPNTPGPGMPPQMGWFPPGAGMFATPHPPHPMQMPAYGFTPYPVPNANLPPGFGASGFGPPPPGVPPAPSRRSSRHGRARSTERMDIFDKWLPGPSYGPVLSSLLIKETKAEVEFNPLITPSSDTRLVWNMLFHVGQCHVSNDDAGRSWANRNVPATWPRVKSLRLISKDFPWLIDVEARDPNCGVSCGDILDAIFQFLHQRISRAEYAAASTELQREISATYHHNRSTHPGVPGGTLRAGVHRFDFLGTATSFGGIVKNEDLVHQICHAPVPCVFELVCDQQPEEAEGRRSRSRVRNRSRNPSRGASRPPTRAPSPQD